MNYRETTKLAFWIFLWIPLLGHISPAQGHSGGTNSSGCHAGSKPYHCHGSSSSRSSSSYTPFRQYRPSYSIPSSNPIETNCTSTGCRITNIDTKPARKPQASPPKIDTTEIEQLGKIKNHEPKEIPPITNNRKDTTNSNRIPTAASIQRRQNAEAVSERSQKDKIEILNPSFSDKSSTKQNPIEFNEPFSSSLSSAKSNQNGSKRENVDRLPKSSVKFLANYKDPKSYSIHDWLFILSMIAILLAISTLQFKKINKKMLLRRIEASIRSEPHFYGDGNTVVKLLRICKQKNQVKLWCLQLEYNPVKPFLTSETNHSFIIPWKSLQANISRDLINNLIGDIPFRKTQLRLISKNTDYFQIVLQQHQAWEALNKANRAKDDLTVILKKIQAGKDKYINSGLFPNSQTTFNDLISKKQNQIEWLDSTVNKLQDIIKKLTLQIESIEEMGGILLNIQDMPLYAEDQDSHQPTSTILEKEYLLNTLFELEAYAEMIS